MCGDWTLAITAGSTYAVETTAPASAITTNLNVLELGCDAPDDERSWAARVHLPTLAGLGVPGRADVELRGIEGERLELSIEGAVELRAMESGALTHLEVDAAGASQLDLSAIAVKNAELNIAGLADVRLHMDGGTLSGNIAGASHIRYSGTATRNFQAAGLSVVEAVGNR